MSAKGVIRPERLPPTKGAAEQHSLRAYLQVVDWMLLQPRSINPENFGWMRENRVYSPIATDEPIAPYKLRNFISCGCKSGAHVSETISNV